MADTFKGKLEEAGHKIAETATKVGHKIGEGVEKATDWAKEKAHEVGHRVDEKVEQMKNRASENAPSTKTVADIAPHMDVIASCGTRIGSVDHLDGNKSIKLTKNDSKSGGQHHWIPTSWVSKVDSHVHLSKNSDDTMRGWKTEPLESAI